MPYNTNLNVSELREKISYNPDTGSLFWSVSPARNVLAGSEAGCVKATRSSKLGEQKSYKYIRLNSQNVPAARIAWALHYGEWPIGRVNFLDGDTLNLKIENLVTTKGIETQYDHSDPEQRKLYMREHREVYTKDWKNADLKRRFGISLHEYGQMLVAQNGKCAICSSTDAGTRDGMPKALAVDHDHRTGKIRGLLCESCNQGIGKLKDDPKILRLAADYLERDLGTSVTQTGQADAAQTT